MKKIVGTVLCVLPSGKSSTISTLLSAMRLAYRMLSPFSSSTENRPLCIFLDTTHFLQFFPFQDAIIHSVMNSQEYIEKRMMQLVQKKKIVPSVL